MNFVWTIMIITFGEGPFDGYETYIPFSNAAICGENIEAQKEQFELDGLKIKMIRCRKTDIPSE
jgi:hypothetical protein